MEHPKDIGDRTTLAVMLALREEGYAVLVPFGENTRYDLVIYDGDRLARVQCKTGRLRSGAVRFPTCSTYGHQRRPGQSRRHYEGQIDYFAVHCPETHGVYLVPIDDIAARSQAALRVAPTRNGQAKRLRWAADYEICEVALTPGLRASAGAGGSSA